MANNSIPYFLNLYSSVANDNCKIFFDFNTASGSIVNVSGVKSEVSGEIIPSTGSFWRNSGSGFFSGNSVKITNTGTSINVFDSTYVLVYENLVSGGATLISTVDTGNNGSGLYYKGFEFGVTANNRLYFEYYSNNGPQVFNSSSVLSDKASVYLTVSNNKISFGDYNYFYSKLNSNDFLIDSNYLFDEKDIYLGYNPNILTGYNYNKRFTGYMEEFLLFSPPIYSNDIVYLNSGFANRFIPDTTYTTQVIINQITGYSTGITGYYTGITGFNVTATGVVVDDFGIQYTGYSQTDLTGMLYGTGIIPLSGDTIITTTGYSGAYTILQSGFINSFGRSRLNILKSIDQNTIVDISLPTGIYEYAYRTNLNANFDYARNSFFDSYASDKGYQLYVSKNGLANISGTNIQVGSVYNAQNSISNDYVVNSANEVLFGAASSGADSVILDTARNSYNTGLYINNFNLSDCYSEYAEIGTGFLATGQSLNFTGNWIDVSSGQSSMVFIYGSGTGIGTVTLQVLSEISGLPSGVNVSVIDNVRSGYSAFIPKISNNFSSFRVIGNGSSLNVWSWATYRIINSETCMSSGYYPSGFGFILEWPTVGNRLFFDGRKMISGRIEDIGINCDYSITPSGLYFDERTGIFSYASGNLLSLPVIFDFNTTGRNNLNTIPNRYYTNYSEVYLSGERLRVGSDYLELARFDTNAGSGIFDINTDILYNNNDLF
jgi:hypothetical protein